MKLIDADKQALLLFNFIIDQKDRFIRLLQFSDNYAISELLMNYFDEQLTAYDLDKVIKEIKTEMLYSYHRSKMHSNLKTQQMYYMGICEAYEHALKMVKAGKDETQYETN